MDLDVFARYRAASGEPQRRLAQLLLDDNMALVTLLTAQLCGWQQTQPADGARRRCALPVLPGASSLARDEALQCGRIGFARALQSFDPSKGKIAYYAALWIRVFLQSAIRAQGASHKPGVVLVDFEEQHDLGEDRCEASEAAIEIGPRVERVTRRLTRRERHLLSAMRGTDYDLRAAARDASIPAAEAEAIWTRVRRWLASPPFESELVDVERFVRDACVLTPGGRAAAAALRAAYSADVSREVSPRRFGIALSRLAPRLGIRPTWLRLRTDGDGNQGEPSTARGWAGVRLVRAPNRRAA